MSQQDENEQNVVEEVEIQQNRPRSPEIQAESQEEQIQRLAEKVQVLTELFEAVLPVVAKFASQENEQEGKIETPEPAIRKPWDQRKGTPTFSEFAGSLAFDSPEHLGRERFKRRDSIFEEAERLEKAAKQPTFRRNVPPFTKKLISLDFSEINKFFKELYAYQSEHDCYEKACPHLSWSVRSILCPPAMTEGLFLQIPNADLFALIRREIRPNSQLEFRELFVENLKFYVKENFVLDANTYREWCTLVKVYFREVQQRFEFLAEDLDKSLIPNLEDKESGLITLVLQRMIPYGTAKSIHDEFYFEFKTTKKKFTLVEYLQAFQKMANKYIQHARDSKALEAAINGKAKYPTSNGFSSKKVEYFAQRKNYTSGYSSADTAKTVQFLDEEVETAPQCGDEISEVLGDKFDEMGDGQKNESRDTEIRNPNVEVMGDVENSLVNFLSEPRAPLKPLIKIGPPSMGINDRVNKEKKGPADFPCIRHILDGRCPFGDACKNSHDEGKCKEYYHTIVKKLQKESPVRPVGQNVQLGVCEDHQQYILSLSKNVDVVKAVFCSGDIEFGNSKIAVNRILLDSGALHGNYLSEIFLHQHGEYLYSMMEDVDELIIMADSSKKCQITKKIRLRLCVQSGLKDLPNCTLVATFSILPNLKHDIIFGLPTLMSELTEIFVARLLHVKGSQYENSSAFESLGVHHIGMISARADSKNQNSRSDLQAKLSSTTSPPGSGALQYKVVLPDSRNPSLRRKFEPRYEYKPSTPDGDLNETDYPEVDSDIPSKASKMPKVSHNRKSPQTTPTRYVVLDPRSGKKSLFHRPQKVPELSPIEDLEESAIGWGSQSSQTNMRASEVINLTSDEETDPRKPLVMESFPQRLPYERVPQYVCNDFRERTPEFRRKLKDFQVYLAQHDHVSVGNWHRSEPFTHEHKDMLQRSVHPDGVHCTVSTMMNLDRQFPNHGIPWGIVRDFQYACKTCRVRRWYAPLTRHRESDCPFNQSAALATVYNLADWSGVQCPPEPIDDDEAVCNWGPYLRVKMERDSNSWMYWVRQPTITDDTFGDGVAKRTKELWYFQKGLRPEDVTPLVMVHSNVNAMELETPLPDMNEVVFCRIELAHNVAGCSTNILPTFLQLDMLFPGHTISPHEVLQYLRSCLVCTSKCITHTHDEGIHPYLYACSPYGDNWSPGTRGGTSVTRMQKSETESSSEHDLGMIEEGPALVTDAMEYSPLATNSSTAEVGHPSNDCFSQDIVLSEEALCHLTTQLHEVVQEFDAPAERDYMERSLIAPWSSTLDDKDAPEDAETPQPSVFAVPLSYMDKTFAQAVLDFKEMIELRVDRSISAVTDIVTLLQTTYLPVFVPHNWLGVQGVPPVVIEVSGDIPDMKKPRARPINPKLLANVKNEFDRLSGYFYAPSTSPFASCLVVAPKKTPPFVRLCGDYREMNKYILARHSPIPNVGNEILRISEFKIFADLDWKTSFHQLPLAVESRKYLSIQTPWAQVEPLFVPEGSKPASGALQDIVRLLFGTLDYVIAIFDNLLVLAHDSQDLYSKLITVLDICLKHNVVLGFAKCNIGVSEVEFFGYVCSYRQYRLSTERKQHIMDLPFPRNQKEVQSVMGTANMFLRFTPNYSVIAKDITDMSAKNFNWDQSTWTVDYRASFTLFKEAIAHCLTLYYPDYTLKWILRTDASLRGCGVVLYQEYVAADGIVQEQVISVLSHKFSDAALRWPTIEQEAYAIYFGVQKLEYLLMCKKFIVETDHRNLVWMETSLVPKIIRWRIYLQAFDMTIRHITGKTNFTADWLSRIHLLARDPEVHNLAQGSDDLQNPAPAASPEFTPRECFDHVHGHRMGHHGVARTMQLLGKYFPSHGLSQKAVAELIAACPHCQKIRLGMDSKLVPMHRTLSQEHLHAAIGCDIVTVTPPDKVGNKYIIVVVNLFSKFVALYPAASHDAITLATALFQYFCTYGVCEKIVSDPGSDLTSEIISELTQLFGIRHIFSLVERHQSNGVEGTNKLVLRHLRSLVHDERLISKWSDPTILPLIQYMLNAEFTSSESGIVPLHAHFGDLDSVFRQLPHSASATDLHQEYVRLLAQNITLVRSVAQEHQRALALERSQASPASDHTTFQPGDYVLKKLEHRPSKLMFQLVGPYRVISQHKNDVQVRSLVYDHILTFHLDQLKPFLGTDEEAKQMAYLDKNQYLIKSIIAYRGDPLVRTSCTFLVLFDDGDLIWLPWSADISATSQFESFCQTRGELYLLLYSAAEAAKLKAATNRMPISDVVPGDTAYIDLRFYGSDWYLSLGLPDCDTTSYVVIFQYTRWFHKTTRTKIVATCPVFGEEWPLNNHFVRSYGRRLSFPDGAVLVDSEFVRQFPQLLSKPGSV